MVLKHGSSRIIRVHVPSVGLYYIWRANICIGISERKVDRSNRRANVERRRHWKRVFSS
jgi:hypothetical protein